MNVKQSTAPIVNDPISVQLQNLDLNSEMGQHVTEPNAESADFAMETMRRNNGNRSISDCGINNTPFHHPVPNPQAQTAPTSSQNFYGFDYQYMMYDNGMSNRVNNLLFQPTNLDNFRFYVPVSHSTNSIRSASPVSDNGNYANVVPTTYVSPTLPSRATTSPDFMWPMVRPNMGHTLPQRPSQSFQNEQFIPIPPISGYIFVPQVSPSLPSSGTTTPRLTPSPNPQSPLTTLPESSESAVAGPKHEMPTMESNSTPFENQLQIDIEHNESSYHYWRPVHSIPQFHPKQVFHLSPNNENQGPSHSSSSSSSSEHGASPSMQYSSFYWNHPGMPVLPPHVFPYPQAPCYPVPAVDNRLYKNSEAIQKHISGQKEALDSLHYELTSVKLDVSNYAAEIRELEQTINMSSVPSEDDIEQLKKEICKLSTECLCLVAEVDKYSEEKALLGELNDDFYSCINTGQQGPLIPKYKKRSKKLSKNSAPQSPPPPPPRPTRDSRNQSRQLSREEEDENSESRKWLCTECTFRNHPRISEYCEMCNQPRSSTSHAGDR